MRILSVKRPMTMVFRVFSAYEFCLAVGLGSANVGFRRRRKPGCGAGAVTTYGY